MVATVIIGGVIGLAVLLILFVFMRSKQVNLAEKTDEKPEWMQTTPPQETVSATKAKGEGTTLFNHEDGEQLAAPFAEQIEDILRAKLDAHPTLKEFKVDLGTDDDYGLAFWVNGKKYSAGVA